MVSAFADDAYPTLRGNLVLVNLDIDFRTSKQPEFDVNFAVWNQNEAYQSRHVHVMQSAVLALDPDLQLDISQIFTAKIQIVANGGILADPNPNSNEAALWAVFYQTYGAVYAWGGNVWQHPLSAKTTSIVLPPVPFNGP